MNRVRVGSSQSTKVENFQNVFLTNIKLNLSALSVEHNSKVYYVVCYTLWFKNFIKTNWTWDTVARRVLYKSVHNKRTSEWDGIPKVQWLCLKIVSSIQIHKLVIELHFVEGNKWLENRSRYLYGIVNFPDLFMFDLLKGTQKKT